MKTNILSLGGITLAALLFAAPASAQVGGGIKAGINLASIHGFNNATTTTSQRTGVIVGGFMTFDITPMVAFQPEVLFSMQGSKLHFSSSGVSSDTTAKLDYLQIPLLLRVGSSASRPASVYVIAGPSVGVLVRANQNGVNIKSDLKRTDVGVAVGAGVTLTRVLFEARYTFDLKDFNKVQAPSGAHTNRVISFMIGLVF